MKKIHKYLPLPILLIVLTFLLVNTTLANNAVKNENKEWHFYWQKFASYEQIKEDLIYPTASVNLPNYWTEINSEDNNITGQGYGTYHKQIILPENNSKPFGIRLQGIDVAYKFFINEQLIKEVGTIATNPKNEIPDYQSTIIQFTPPSDTIDLIIQVSNFHHRRGGIWKKIEIGDYETLFLKAEKDEFYDYISLSIMLAFGIFFSIFHLFNRQEKALPLFGLTFIAIFITGITINFYPISIISNIAWSNIVRLEYIGHFSTLAFLNWAFYNILPLKLHRQFLLVISSILVILSILIVVTPVSLFAFTLWVFYVLLGVSIVAIISQFVYGLKSNFKVSALIIIGITALILAALNDILISLGYNALTNNYILNKIFIFFLLILAIGFFNAYSNRFNKEKSLRKSLSFANTSLEKIIDERTEKLLKNEQIIKDQNQTLSNENYVKNRVLAIIGHDLRSPIASVIQDLDLIDLIDDRELEKIAIENVKQNIESLYNMVDNLLSWALNKDKRLKYTPEEANISEIVQSVISQHIHIARNKNIQINNKAIDEKSIVCDIYTTSIIIRNLLSNAIKFTPENGEINFFSKYINDTVQLEIKDNGIGMKQDRISEILEGNSNTSSNGTNIELGTGIGLSLVKDFIALNNGELSISSEKGKGTSIFITLPVMK